MDTISRFRPIGIGFGCGGLGLLVGGLVADTPSLLGAGLAFAGMGVVLLARARSTGARP